MNDTRARTQLPLLIPNIGAHHPIPHIVVTGKDYDDRSAQLDAYCWVTHITLTRTHRMYQFGNPSSHSTIIRPCKYIAYHIHSSIRQSLWRLLIIVSAFPLTVLPSANSVRDLPHMHAMSSSSSSTASHEYGLRCEMYTHVDEAHIQAVSCELVGSRCTRLVAALDIKRICLSEFQLADPRDVSHCAFAQRTVILFDMPQSAQKACTIHIIVRLSMLHELTCRDVRDSRARTSSNWVNTAYYTHTMLA